MPGMTGRVRSLRESMCRASSSPPTRGGPGRNRRIPVSRRVSRPVVWGSRTRRRVSRRPPTRDACRIRQDRSGPCPTTPRTTSSPAGRLDAAPDRQCRFVYRRILEDSAVERVGVHDDRASMAAGRHSGRRSFSNCRESEGSVGFGRRARTWVRATRWPRPTTPTGFVCTSPSPTTSRRSPTHTRSWRGQCNGRTDRLGRAMS